MSTRETHDPGHPHLFSGEFQSDKYPTTPRGKVPLSTKDKLAQDLLWTYAQRRRPVDPQFSADLETALLYAGHIPKETPRPSASRAPQPTLRSLLKLWFKQLRCPHPEKHVFYPAPRTEV